MKNVTVKLYMKLKYKTLKVALLEIRNLKQHMFMEKNYEMCWKYGTIIKN